MDGNVSRTKHGLDALFQSGKRVVEPYECDGDKDENEASETDERPTTRGRADRIVVDLNDVFERGNRFAVVERCAVGSPGLGTLRRDGSGR